MFSASQHEEAGKQETVPYAKCEQQRLALTPTQGRLTRIDPFHFSAVCIMRQRERERERE